MRQLRRQTPTLSSLTVLRALAGVLVAAAVLSAPIQITPAQRGAAPAQPGPAAAPAPPPVAYEADRRNADETRDRLRQVIEQYSPSLFEVFRHDPSLLMND